MTTPLDKARAGLTLLKEAVLEYLATRPNGAAPANEIRDALDLHDENLKGEHKGRLVWGLSNLLKKEGKVRTEKINGRNHMVLETAVKAP